MPAVGGSGVSALTYIGPITPGDVASWLVSGVLEDGGHGGSRIIVRTSNIDFYVDPINGNDSNNGLTPATAFLTPQACWNNIAENYDGGGNTAKINLLPGTYNANTYPDGAIIQFSATVGFVEIFIVSSTRNPPDVILETQGAEGFTAFNEVLDPEIFMGYMTFQCSSGGASFIDVESCIGFFEVQNCVIKTTAGSFPLFCSGFGTFVGVNTNTFSGDCGCLFYASQGAIMVVNHAFMSGTQNFSVGLFGGDNHGVIITDNLVLTGTLTSPKFSLATGSNVTFFAQAIEQTPGTSWGTVDPTSQVYAASYRGSFQYPGYNPGILHDHYGGI